MRPWIRWLTTLMALTAMVIAVATLAVGRGRVRRRGVVRRSLRYHPGGQDLGGRSHRFFAHRHVEFLFPFGAVTGPGFTRCPGAVDRLLHRPNRCSCPRRMGAGARAPAKF